MINNKIKKYLGYVMVSISTFLVSWNMSLSLNIPTPVVTPLMQKENKRLKANNRKLQKENRVLIAKQKKMKKKIIQHRKDRVKKLVNRSKNKIATAPAKMVPLLGVTAIIAMTTYDIKSYCEDIDSMKALETTLFGDIESDDSLLEVKEICNMDIEKKLKPILGDKYDSIKDSFNGSMKWLETLFD